MTHDVNKVPGKLLRKCHPAGSRYTCKPPVMDTDEDYAVLVGSFSEYAQHLLDEGWDVTIADAGYATPNGEHPFITARKEELNLIIFTSEYGYDLFVTATELAKRFNLLDKKDRVDLFGAIRGGRQ